MKITEEIRPSYACLPSIHACVLILFVKASVTRPFCLSFSYLTVSLFLAALDVGSFCSKPDDRGSLRFRLGLVMGRKWSRTNNPLHHPPIPICFCHL